MDFLKTEQIDGRTQATFIGNECKMYIPEDYFSEGKFAQMKGLLCETMGIFYFEADGDLRMLNFPSKIQFEYTGDFEKKRLILKPGMNSILYRVFTLKKGNAFVWDQHMEKSTDGLLFPIAQYLEGGKFPKFLKYTELVNVVLNMLKVAGEPADFFDVPFMLIELVISSASRYSKDTNIPMRKKYNGQNAYDFTYVPLKRVTATLSTLNAILGEDMSKQLLHAILRSKEGVSEPESPIEKILKY